MDEIQMVRESYPEPAPPTSREIARAKALLNESPQRSLPRLRWALGGVVAAGTVAIMAITLVGGNPAPAPGSVNPDDLAALLASVEKMEPEPIGRYWYSDQVQGQSYLVRAKTGTYAITGGLDEVLQWWGAKPGTGEAFYGRDLPSRPASAADAALWRKDGSPSSFRVWTSGDYYTYTTKATKWERDPDVPFDGGKFLNGKKSLEDLQNLPSDPATLAEMFLVQTPMPIGTPPVAPPSGQAEMNPNLHQSQPSSPPPNPLEPRPKIFAVERILAETPLPPKVRAGLIRALAAQPGVHTIGQVTDPLGRRGVALASEEHATTITGEYGEPEAEQGTYRSREVIIFDERTGALLSAQEELTTPGGRYTDLKPGFIINYRAVRSAEWTDTKPKPPAELPFD
jgi:hypothetical protein